MLVKFPFNHKFFKCFRCHLYVGNKSSDFTFVNSGFGFVTYKTVEAAKKAIEDTQKLLGVSDYNESSIHYIFLHARLFRG